MDLMKQGEIHQMENWGKCFSLFLVSPCFIFLLEETELDKTSARTAGGAIYQ